MSVRGTGGLRACDWTGGNSGAATVVVFRPPRERGTVPPIVLSRRVVSKSVKPTLLMPRGSCKVPQSLSRHAWLLVVFKHVAQFFGKFQRDQ